MPHKLRIALAAFVVALAAVSAVDAAFAMQVPEQEVARDRRAVGSASASLRYQDTDPSFFGTPAPDRDDHPDSRFARWRLDCLAGHVRFELANPLASYPLGIP
jgi:hypothetical protein